MCRTVSVSPGAVRSPRRVQFSPTHNTITTLCSDIQLVFSFTLVGSVGSVSYVVTVITALEQDAQ